LREEHSEVLGSHVSEIARADRVDQRQYR
jgi:hypothetical protein